MNKLIKLSDTHYIIVDDSEIIGGDYRVNIQRGYIQLVDDNPEYYNKRNDVFKKVIAHLPLNNSPILEGVPLLPPLEQEDEAICPYPESKQNAVDWYNGYSKAKEKYKYTEEDMRGFHKFFMEIGTNSIYDALTLYIQSLSQPKMPIGFECEMGTLYFYKKKWVNTLPKSQVDKLVKTKRIIKTTTNPKGQTQWVGKYIY